MKRIIICGLIMITLVIIGIISLFYTESVTDAAARKVDEISASFENGDYDLTRRLSGELDKSWQDYYQGHIFMVDKDHAMEISMSISRIKSMAEQEDDDLPTECGTAQDLIQLYRRKHDLTLENIF